jgi:hypothetical protein
MAKIKQEESDEDQKKPKILLLVRLKLIQFPNQPITMLKEQKLILLPDQQTMKLEEKQLVHLTNQLVVQLKLQKRLRERLLKLLLNTMDQNWTKPLLAHNSE